VTARAREYAATVLRREQLSPHLVRLVLGDVHGPDPFTTTGIPDEWVGLVVPGQFQSRYYTVRSWDGVELVLDVVVHDEGLVTEWAWSSGRDCVGDRVTVSEAKGSFAMSPTASWLILVGDLTAMPAMARILESVSTSSAGPGRAGRELSAVRVFAEVADDLPGYLPAGTDVTWLDPPAAGESALAAVVEDIEWPEGEGYFWMAGESSQMRAIRKHLMREVGLPSTAYDVMGYWRGGATRQPRAVDPGPIWRAGRAAGRSDEQIWAAYDSAQERAYGSDRR
jgi:NADPH-dependent ferric siderophore reductase